MIRFSFRPLRYDASPLTVLFTRRGARCFNGIGEAATGAFLFPRFIVRYRPFDWELDG